MKAIDGMLSEVTAGSARSHKNLTVVPLMLAEDQEPGYKTLDRALADGEISVTEMSEGGSVPELRMANMGDQAVLLLDGDELIGAKQNRILNLSILAPANCSLDIPVSCVEQGRWQHNSDEFSSKGRTMYSAGRARKASQITHSLRTIGESRSQQQGIWEDLTMKFRRMDCESVTESMSDLYESFNTQVEQYSIPLAEAGHPAGAVFAINGQVRGMELFDSPQIFRELYSKLNKSYALDAIDEFGRDDSGVDNSLEAFILATKAAATSSHLALGEGEDVRISSPKIAGGALVARDRLIHLCAFNIPTGERQRREGAIRRSLIVDR